MASDVTFRPIGHVRTAGGGVASQAAEASGATGEVVVDPAFHDGLLGLDRHAHLWLVTWLDDWPEGHVAPLRQVPRALAATGEVQGVFASRSPDRPNPIGLSLVRHVSTVDGVLTFAGVDLLDGTPVLDIKPFYDDCDRPPIGT